MDTVTSSTECNAYLSERRLMGEGGGGGGDGRRGSWRERERVCVCVEWHT